MFSNLTHLGYTFLFGGIPALILLLLYKRLFLQHLPIVIKTLLVILPIGVIADSVAVRKTIWFYPQDKRLGIDLLNSPIENLVFGFVVGILISLFSFVFLDLERKNASVATWLKTVIGIGSLAIIPTSIMLLLRLLVLSI